MVSFVIAVMFSADISTCHYSVTAMSYTFWLRPAALGFAEEKQNSTEDKNIFWKAHKENGIPFLLTVFSSHANTPSRKYT